MPKRLLPCLLFTFAFTSAAFGQVQSPAPPLRRWFEFQTLTVYTRYRFTENNKDVTTANQLQYKDNIRARVNIDEKKRYTINFGFLSGNTFISSWPNWGVGNDTNFDGWSNYFRQIYGAAVPVDGLELQFGGLFVNRGEGDEWTTYDDDGYVGGGRVTVRRPNELYLDEITVTRAAMGPFNTPNLFDRWDTLTHPDYTQVLGVKRFNQMISGSFEYERRIGADYLRPAVTIRFAAGAPVSTLRVEAYRRVNPDTADGLGVWAERPVTKYARVQAGYVTIDPGYGGWNADRMQSGRRVFANATIPIHGPLSASVYATQAFSEPYNVSVHRRVDVIISYDVLSSLHKAGVL